MSKDIDWGLAWGEGTIVCTCDKCGHYEEFEFEDGPDFREVQDELKQRGWVSRKINGEWYDFCSKECYLAYVKQLAANAVKMDFGR